MCAQDVQIHVYYKTTLGSKENYIKQRQLSVRRASTGLTVGEACLTTVLRILLESQASILESI
jgi:hypothetical protein